MTGPPPDPVAAAARRDDRADAAYVAILVRLAGLGQVGVRLGLERTARALAALGEPQRRLRVVHVAGTNGKGSTAAMLAACLQAAGQRTGLYTSPHLCRFTERIRVDGVEIPRAALARLVDRALALEPGLTFFEAATVAGLAYFAEQHVDVAVIETGLGGRLDATNVLQPLVVVITRIDLDHQELLGPDVAAIAGEKAGIIKPGAAVVAADSGPVATAILVARAAACGAPLRLAGRDFALAPEAGPRGAGEGALRFTRRAIDGEAPWVVDGLRLALAGAHQRENAALCLAALAELRRCGVRVADAEARRGLAAVRWPGRLERIGDVLLDGAHNGGGARALAAALAEEGRAVTLIVGLLGPKDPRGVLEPLLAHAAHVVCTRPASPRALPPGSLAALAPGAATAPDLRAALAAARTVGRPIVITGSLYLVGEARALLLGEATDPIVAVDPLGVVAAVATVAVGPPGVVAAVATVAVGPSGAVATAPLGVAADPPGVAADPPGGSVVGDADRQPGSSLAPRPDAAREDWFDRVPKVELHLHLEGAIPLDTLWQLITKYGGDPAVPDRAALARRFAYRDFPHFIDTWIWKNGFLRELEDFTLIAEAVARDLAAQHVRYVEAFYSPADFARHGLEPQRLTAAIRAGLDRVPQIGVGLIADLVRDFGPERGREMLELIAGLRGLGVIGIGLGGSEQRYPPEPWAAVFAEARRRGLHTTAHAGEAAGAASVWGALRALGVDRLGHATRAVEDPELVDHLAAQRVPLELCPLSNVRTGVVPDLAAHPVRRYLERGLVLSINTDDPQMFHTSLAAEYRALAAVHGLTRNDVRGLILAAARASWLDDAGRRELAAALVGDEAWADVG